ncbi:MAG: ferredoxin [Candidatus Micrarchaeota archaeon]
MGKKYIVKYDREGCIGAAACVAADPKDWVLSNEDAKADLASSAKDEATGMFVREIDGADFAANKLAAQGCPVKVIKIYDKDSGAQVV